MRSVLVLVVLVLCGACSRPAPPVPVAGVYAVKTPGSLARGSKKKPSLRRAQPGVTVLSDARIEAAEGGLVLEVFDTSFVYVPAGVHEVKALHLRPVPPDGAVRKVQWITDQATAKEIPAPMVTPRYEAPQSLKPLKSEEDKEFESDVAYFFLPKGETPENEDPTPKGPPAPWMMKDPYVHALKRPLKSGDGARQLTGAKGVVVVEFADQATAFAATLKLPLDLADVRRIVVLDGGSATVTLPSGKTVKLGEGDIGEIGPLP